MGVAVVSFDVRGSIPLRPVLDYLHIDPSWNPEESTMDEYSKIMARLDTIEDLLLFIFRNNLSAEQAKKFFSGGDPLKITESH